MNTLNCRLIFFVLSITEFKTKILAVSVKERKVSFLLIGNNCLSAKKKLSFSIRNVCTNYNFKTVQNKFVEEISLQKIGL